MCDFAGSYGLYSFSASAAFSQAKSGTETHEKVNRDHKEICNYGDLRYLDYESYSQPTVSDEFIRDVKALPSAYNQYSYVTFIERWGTVSYFKHSQHYNTHCQEIILLF